MNSTILFCACFYLFMYAVSVALLIQLSLKAHTASIRDVLEKLEVLSKEHQGSDVGHAAVDLFKTFVKECARGERRALFFRCLKLSILFAPVVFVAKLFDSDTFDEEFYLEFREASLAEIETQLCELADEASLLPFKVFFTRIISDIRTLRASEGE